MSRGVHPDRGAARITGHELLLVLLVALILAWLMSIVLVAPAHGGADLPADPDRTAVTSAPSVPLPAPVLPRAARAPAPAAATGITVAYDDIGGDDAIVTTTSDLGTSTRQPIAIAHDGTIYVAVWIELDVNTSYLRILRSTDSGVTWQPWGTRGGTAGVHYEQPALRIAEGDQDRLVLAYRYRAAGAAEIRISWSPLSASPAWTEVIALSDGGVSFEYPSLDSDAINVSAYTLFLAAAGQDADGKDVWFTRSTTFGDSWEAGYRIADMPLATRDYWMPEIRYGWGGIVHCVFQFSTRDGSADWAVRYRRALNRAALGVGDWQTTVYLTPNNDGHDEGMPTVAAAYGNMWTVVGWSSERPDGLMFGTGLRASSDAGATWPAAYTDSLQWVYDLGLKALPGIEGFIAGASMSGEKFGLLRASNGLPLSWSAPLSFVDRSYSDFYIGSLSDNFDFDPAHADRVAMVWTRVGEGSAGDTVFFDAEWKRDVGWPNLEAGMPRAIPAPISAPAIVELDGDVESEILYGDQSGNVQVLNHDGSVVAGWPQNVGSFSGPAAVAAGDLDGDGRYEVVAGNGSGVVYAWRPDGTPLDGWPVDLGTAKQVYVSIGALLADSPRQVVAASGSRLTLLRRDGAVAPGWPSYKVAEFLGPAAIGDVDDDGANEVVSIFGTFMNVQSAAGAVRWYRNLSSAGKSFVEGPSLGDLDLDGNLEIAAPTLQGDVYVLHADGGDMAGWPWHDGTAYAASSVAMAHIWAGMEPELAFAIEDAATPHAHLLDHDGLSIGTWPNPTGAGWFLRGAPILDGTLGPPAYWMVIAGARDSRGYAWLNDGARVPGWPKDLPSRCSVSPASGDIDADGRLEVVYLTEVPGEMTVVDLGAPVHRRDLSLTMQWPMLGYNHERQACLACGLDAVTVVPPGDPDVPVLARLDPPRPNPMRDALTLRFALPAPAAARLEMYDVQGRLVRTLLRRELAAGVHDATWDGRDASGAVTAAGVYYVRLALVGPTGERTMMRRVVRLP